MEELPYRAEYAKSNRSKCKGCKMPIAQEVLRLAVMVQSSFSDSKQPNWFHEKCFFQKQRPKTVGDIEGFNGLRFEDQKRITDSIANPAAPEGTKKKGKKALEAAATKDFGVEYAKSGRASCRGCEQLIAKGVVRIKKVAFDTEVGMKYGGQALWHHLECFAQIRDDLEWTESGDKLPGFNSLSKEDKANVKAALPSSATGPPLKKVKVEPEIKAEEDKIDKTIEAQSKRIYKFHAILKTMKKNELLELLAANKQGEIKGTSEKIQHLADAMTFGAIQACPDCSGQLTLHKSGYLCTGNRNEWLKCMTIVKEPKRKPFKLPEHLTSWFPNYRAKVGKRVFNYVAPTVSSTAVKKEEEDLGPKVKRDKPPLYRMEFVILGATNTPKKEIEQAIIKHGGRLVTKISEKTIAIISTPEEVEKCNSRMQKAKDLGIHVVLEDFLEEVDKDWTISRIVSGSICDWGTDPSARLPVEEAKSASRSIYTKSVPKSVTLTVKNGTAVDPDSGLEHSTHVYHNKSDYYTAVLTNTDYQTNKNSYYKLQLLKSDVGSQYYVFRSWGRIGTTVGSNKLTNFNSSKSALKEFELHFSEKTGNEWQNRHNFVKHPGRYTMVDIQMDEETEAMENDVESKLPKPVQDLVKLLFDINMMKSTMKKYELDLDKMPLGNLSKSQLKKALTVLATLNAEVSSDIQRYDLLVQETNKFYNLVPHSAGITQPPLLDNKKIVQDKFNMIENLMEIECAYSLLKTVGEDDQLSSIDSNYNKLNTTLQPLDKKSERYAILEKYVKNTHAQTHDSYTIDIVDIFEVSRGGETRRFRPFEKMPNHKLLWHGSRLTNYVGILTNGLRIAPPEAPVTGYMFGKGVYFADMVSKSANYCFADKANNTGLLMLCDVACGQIERLTKAKYVTTLPSGKDSVMGVGRTQPDPKESVVLDDKLEVPLGPAVTDSSIQTSLLYNEYIVYDEAQVKVKYLFRVKMNFKY